MQVGNVGSPVQLCQIMLRYSLRVLYILSTGCLQANWWVVVQDFKQNKQIKRESWCVEWYFYYLVFYFLSIRKIIQSLTKSPIYFKEEKLNFTCWLMNHDPKLARILSYHYFLSFRKTWSVLLFSLELLVGLIHVSFYIMVMVTTYQNISRTSNDPIYNLNSNFNS